MDSREFTEKPKREIPDMVNYSAKSVGWASERRLDMYLEDIYEKGIKLIENSIKE